MDLGIPPLKFEIVVESNPLKSRILARRLAVRPISQSKLPVQIAARELRAKGGDSVRMAVHVCLDCGPRGACT